jgi:hypothetical protein
MLDYSLVRSDEKEGRVGAVTFDFYQIKVCRWTVGSHKIAYDFYLMRIHTVKCNCYSLGNKVIRFIRAI